MYSNQNSKRQKFCLILSSYLHPYFGVLLKRLQFSVWHEKHHCSHLPSHHDYSYYQLQTTISLAPLAHFLTTSRKVRPLQQWHRHASPLLSSSPRWRRPANYVAAFYVAAAGRGYRSKLTTVWKFKLPLRQFNEASFHSPRWFPFPPPPTRRRSTLPDLLEGSAAARRTRALIRVSGGQRLRSLVSVPFAGRDSCAW